MEQYSIYEGNMERLEKKLVSIFNKCKNFGCEFKYRRVGEEFKELVDSLGNKYTARFILVEVDGKAVMNGWKFIATIEHTEKGNIIKRVEDVKVPKKYYHSDTICEHCNTKRQRKDTYLVMNEKSGEFYQVGKSCLGVFTDGLSAEAVTYYISLFDELIKGEVPRDGRGKRYYKTETILRYFFETIKHFGYVKTRDIGINTADRAFGYYCVENCEHSMLEGVKTKLIQEMESVGFNATSAEVFQNLDFIARGK